MMQIFVRKPEGNITTLNVESNERICSVKRKLKEKEGIRSDLHLGLIYNGKLLDDGQTLAHYNIWKEYTLRLLSSQDALDQTWDLYVTWSKKILTLKVKSMDTIDDVKAKIQENVGIPPHKQLLFRLDELLEDGSRTLADYYIHFSTLQLAIQFQQEGSQSPNVTSQGARTSEQAPLITPPAPRQAKRARPATQTTRTKSTPSSAGEAAAALSDMMPKIRSDPPSSMLTELEDLIKREMTTARSNFVALEAENKKKEEKLTVARKELETTISGLKAENKKTEQELMVARNKEKEQEATVSILTHKNKVFSSQCASIGNQLVALEAENKKTKQELMVADNKYSGAWTAGYAEGLKEGKGKWLKSVEFLHHLTDASMRYFNHGFDSCQSPEASRAARICGKTE